MRFKIEDFVQQKGMEEIPFDGKIIKLKNKGKIAMIVWEYKGRTIIEDQLVCDLVPSTLYGRKNYDI